MSTTLAVWLLIGVAAVTANLPWLTSRFLLVFLAKGDKPGWMRLLEWFLYYLITGALALGLERKVTGGLYGQDWEFYAVTLVLFLVLALPGFIYHYELKRRLHRRRG